MPTALPERTANPMKSLRRLLPTPEALRQSRWLRWLGPALFHPRLWHTSRRGIALGAAIGVFFAFLIPIAQIPMSAALAVALRANIPVAVASTLVNNPLTFPPVYYAAWRVGSWMLGEPEPDEADAPQMPEALEKAVEKAVEEAVREAGGTRPPADQRTWWERTRAGFAAVGKPLLLGAATFAFVFGALTYAVVNGVWHLRVRRKRRARLAGASRAQPPSITGSGD